MALTRQVVQKGVIIRLRVESDPRVVDYALNDCAHHANVERPLVILEVLDHDGLVHIQEFLFHLSEFPARGCQPAPTQ